MTLEEFIGGHGQRSRPFYGSGKVRKDIEKARDLFSDYDYSQNHQS